MKNLQFLVVVTLAAVASAAINIPDSDKDTVEKQRQNFEEQTGSSCYVSGFQSQTRSEPDGSYTKTITTNTYTMKCGSSTGKFTLISTKQTPNQGAGGDSDEGEDNSSGGSDEPSTGGKADFGGDYCKLPCKDPWSGAMEQHTMCLHPTRSNTCDFKKSVPLDDAAKKVLVDAHNELRNKLALGQESRGAPGPQPGAANMLKMEWDDELSTIAQRWADQCRFEHDSCRRVERFGVGQNIFQGMSSNDQPRADWKQAVTEWFDEVTMQPNNNVSPVTPNSDIGHYTQVSWATSRKVGCGGSYYFEDGWYTHLIVCNYGPAGNMQDGTMYIEGPACSKCPKGTSCDGTFPGLCAFN